jgi:SAM-dependent methyltransferase
MTEPSRIPLTRIRNVRLLERVPYVLDVCRGKKVLHLGCADYPFTSDRGDTLLHTQLSAVTDPEHLWGLDSSEEGLAALSDMGFENLLRGNVESLPPELLAEDFDVILAGELIEHLDAPGHFLASAAAVMSQRSELLITTPNATTIAGLGRALLGSERVHPDHNYYYSYVTLHQLLAKHGLAPFTADVYRGTGRTGLRGIPHTIKNLVLRAAPLWADGLVFRARRVSEAPNSSKS